MHRIPRRASIVCAATVALLAVSAAPALAHVTVTTVGPATQGGDAVLDFLVPSESNTASTVKLDVTFDTPLASVSPQAIAGWHIAVRKTRLAHPVTTDDGKITIGVGEVTWTAEGSGPTAGVTPEDFGQFFLAVGPLPARPTMTFRAIQTYSNGDVVKWIETQAPGATEPEHPAPVLHLTPASTSATATPSPAATTASPSTKDDRARGISIAALAVAVVAAALAMTGLRKRT